MEIYNEMMKKDPEGFTKALNDMQKKNEEDQKEDSEGGTTIQPKQGFVVKTKDDSGNKIFINMTSHECVEGP